MDCSVDCFQPARISQKSLNKHRLDLERPSPLPDHRGSRGTIEQVVRGLGRGARPTVFPSEATVWGLTVLDATLAWRGTRNMLLGVAWR